MRRLSAAFLIRKNALVSSSPQGAPASIPTGPPDTLGAPSKKNGT